MGIHFLLVGLGGAIGAMLRHGAGLLILRLVGPGFPWGTVLVNVAGSFLIGILAGAFALMTTWSQEARLFAVVGILGGFTTFSAFSLDALLLLERGQTVYAALYILVSVIMSIAAAALGLWLMRGVMA